MAANGLICGNLRSLRIVFSETEIRRHRAKRRARPEESRRRLFALFEQLLPERILWVARAEGEYRVG
jgi:hypothetical protein